MFDDLQSDGLNDGRKRERPGQPERPLSDREVPLGPPSASIAEAVHAWLDGEAPESSVRRAEWSRDVDFWKRMNEDLERRRRMRTPAHVQARIMEAIPQHAPSLITPWWRREFVVTPSSALVAAATLLAVAVAATAAILRVMR
jgi:hypothetical protein